MYRNPTLPVLVYLWHWKVQSTESNDNWTLKIFQTNSFLPVLPFYVHLEYIAIILFSLIYVHSVRRILMYGMLSFATEDSLRSIHIAAIAFNILYSSSGEGLPWATDCGWSDQRLLRTCQPAGEVWPSSRQVHGLLHAVPWGCGAQGRQRCHCHHQDQAHHPVRGLVSHWFQGKNLAVNSFWAIEEIACKSELSL